MSDNKVLTDLAPQIPQQCANGGVDWSSLSKTQKKKLKAKIKNNALIEGVNSAFQEENNPIRPTSTNNAHLKLVGNPFED